MMKIWNYNLVCEELQFQNLSYIIWSPFLFEQYINKECGYPIKH
jgi:hypothetical protein